MYGLPYAVCRRAKRKKAVEPATKHQITGCGERAVSREMDGPTGLARLYSGANGDREKNYVKLTTSRIGDHIRLT